MNTDGLIACEVQAEPSPLVLLNAPILTSTGVFRATGVSLEEAQARVIRQGFESAIGHAPTALLLSELLGIDCPMRRIEFRQQPGQAALVFRLASRLEEGRVLANREEIMAVGFSFMLIERLE
ncbi:STIV orfB116 family protein [Zoogloea sp.]|uniref:STIV orfB116 family protein n=1 Tax=Zoogloea sp. TaxID=49181 RepID=UPI0035AF731F